MDAAHDPRRQLGQLMIDEGFLTDEQLSDALAEQGRTGQPLGKVLVELGYVSPGAVANALAEQHGGLLKTEYGTSAGLSERAPQSPLRADSAQPASPASTPASPASQAPAPSAPLGAGLRLAQPAVAIPVAEAPVAEAPAAPAAPPESQPELPAPEVEDLPPAADASSVRIEELESQLHGVLTERNSLAQSFNELQIRLNEAAQAHEAGVSAEVAERVGAIESRLQAELAAREELERAQQLAASRVAELEAQLQSAAAQRSEIEELSSTQISELNGELEQLRARDDSDDGHQAAEIEAFRVQLQEVSEQRDAAEGRASALENDLTPLRSERDSLAQSFNELQAAMAGREELASTQTAELNSELEELRTAAAEREDRLESMSGLEAELEGLRARADHDGDHQAAEIEAFRVQLQEVSEQRDAAEVRASALENDLTPLRSELESLREQAAGADDSYAVRFAELSQALHDASAERDAAVERVAPLGLELASLRDRVSVLAAERDAAPDGRAATDPEAGALREQLAARERRLAESVAEIAKMNREHRALLQLVERQYQLEESTTAVPETKGEAAHVLFVPTATGYTLVEEDGAAPEAGEVVDLDAGRFIVRRLGPSPLPGPRRRCAYLERA